jgi:hypothetical protein
MVGRFEDMCNRIFDFQVRNGVPQVSGLQESDSV